MPKREEIDEVRKQVGALRVQGALHRRGRTRGHWSRWCGDVTACMESIEAMPQVDNVVRILGAV